MNTKISPKPKTVVELFEGHPERWIQNSAYTTDDGKFLPMEECTRFCIAGAIEFIYGANERSYNLVNHSMSNSIFGWNDAPERTFEEVLEKCKKLGI